MARVAVITGASSGIGAELARRLADRGWAPVLVARREELLRELAAEVGGEYELCDVGVRADVERMAQAVTARHPRIDLLVNNAGMSARQDFLDGDLDRIEQVIRVNYLGSVWCLRAFQAALQAAAPSHLVNVVSVAGEIATGASGPYAASKHAQLAFSRSITPGLRARGVHVHTILPGFAETEGFPQRSVLPRYLHPLILESRDVADAIVRAVERDRPEVLVPWWYRLPVVFQAAVPGLVSRLGARALPRKPG